MSRGTILLVAGICGLIGGYVPVLLGLDDGFGLWSIIGGLVGGLFGIWLAVKIAKRF